jgi:hemerythrin-like domain-containing protein
MVQRFELYGAVHKGQRRAIFNLGIRAGSLDPEDSSALDALMKDLVELRDEMRSHAELEEKFIHPILRARSAGGARSLEADHEEMHVMLDDMVEQLETTRGKDFPPEVQGDMVKEFYHAWCRFTSFYLIHIDGEDEYIQPTLWRLCTDQELMKVFSDIIAYQKPEELMFVLGMMLPAMAPKERVELMAGARGMMPPPAFQGVMDMARRVLSPTEYQRLKDGLGP